MTYQTTVEGWPPDLYLPFTETTGAVGTAVFADATGNGHDGIMDSLDTVPGGGDSFLDGEKAALLASGNEVEFEAGAGFPEYFYLSVDFWLKIGGTIPSDDLPEGLLQFFLYDAGTGVLRVTLVQDGSSAFHISFGFGAVTVDVPFTLSHPLCWHYYMVVMDGGGVALYVDGALLGRIADARVTGFDFSPDHGGWSNNSQVSLLLAHSALYFFGFTADQVATNYAAATPRQDAGCFAEWVRLRHVGGRGYWQSKGDVTEEWAGGAKRLAPPFAQMTPPAEYVLGKDPSSGLPMWVDPPAAASSVPVAPVAVPSPTPPVVPPAAGDDCVQTRCGAAVALETKLVGDYGNWRQWINAAIKFAIGGLIASVIAELSALLATLEVAAWILQVFNVVTPIIGTTTVTLLPTLIPALTVPQEDRLLQLFFCQVRCAGGAVAFSVADQHAVSAAILADHATYPSDLMRELLGEIVYYDPVQDWQAAMSNAPVSGLCDGLTCP